MKDCSCSTATYTVTFFRIIKQFKLYILFMTQALCWVYADAGYKLVQYLCPLVGFGARARPCAACTRLFGLIATPNGALRAPPHRSFAAPPKNKKINSFQKQNYFLQTQTRADRGTLTFRGGFGGEPITTMGHTFCYSRYTIIYRRPMLWNIMSPDLRLAHRSFADHYDK